MAKWIGTKRRKERKEAKKGRGKKTMIRGACIAGPSNIQYGPEGERGREGHARITTYPARQRVRTCYGWKAYPGNPLRRETWIRSRARSHARPAVPWTRYRERESPTTLSNWSAPDPIPRSSHIDADNYAYARSLSVPFPRRGFRGFPNCEIGIGSRLLYRANGWMAGGNRGSRCCCFAESTSGRMEISLPPVGGEFREFSLWCGRLLLFEYFVDTSICVDFMIRGFGNRYTTVSRFSSRGTMSIDHCTIWIVLMMRMARLLFRCVLDK